MTPSTTCACPTLHPQPGWDILIWHTCAESGARTANVPPAMHIGSADIELCIQSLSKGSVCDTWVSDRTGMHNSSHANSYLPEGTVLTAMSQVCDHGCDSYN